MSFFENIMLHPLKASASIDNCQRIRNERENPYINEILDQELDSDTKVDAVGEELNEKPNKIKQYEEEYSYEETISYVSDKAEEKVSIDQVIEVKVECEENEIKPKLENENDKKPEVEEKEHDLLPNPNIEEVNKKEEIQNTNEKNNNKNKNIYNLKQKSELASSQSCFKKNMYHLIEIVAINSYNVIFKNTYPVRLEMKVCDFVKKWVASHNIELQKTVVFINGLVLDKNIMNNEFSFFIKNICKNKNLLDGGSDVVKEIKNTNECNKDNK